MHAEEPPSAPELDAVVAAAEQQLRALASENPLDAGPLAEALADAATAAIASGQPIADIARAEQRGQQQARTAAGADSTLARSARTRRTRGPPPTRRRARPPPGGRPNRTVRTSPARDRRGCPARSWHHPRDRGPRRRPRRDAPVRGQRDADPRERPNVTHRGRRTRTTRYAVTVHRRRRTFVDTALLFVLTMAPAASTTDRRTPRLISGMGSDRPRQNGLEGSPVISRRLRKLGANRAERSLAQRGSWRLLHNGQIAPGSRTWATRPQAPTSRAAQSKLGEHQVPLARTTAGWVKCRRRWPRPPAPGAFLRPGRSADEPSGFDRDDCAIVDDDAPGEPPAAGELDRSSAPAPSSQPSFVGYPRPRDAPGARRGSARRASPRNCARQKPTPETLNPPNITAPKRAVASEGPRAGAATTTPDRKRPGSTPHREPRETGPAVAALARRASRRRDATPSHPDSLCSSGVAIR